MPNWNEKFIKDIMTWMNNRDAADFGGEWKEKAKWERKLGNVNSQAYINEAARRRNPRQQAAEQISQQQTQTPSQANFSSATGREEEKKKDDNDKNPPNPPSNPPAVQSRPAWKSLLERRQPPEKDDDEKQIFEDIMKSKELMMTGHGAETPQQALAGLGALATGVAATELAPVFAAAAAAAPEAATAGALGITKLLEGQLGKFILQQIMK